MSFITDLLLSKDMGKGYTLAIDDYLVRRQNKNNSSGRKNAVHPSGISHECLRNLYYQFFRIPTEANDPQMERIFDTGNSMHERYHKYAKDAGILVINEMKIWNKEYQIRAQIDQLVLLDEKLKLVELKSMKQEKFNYLMGKPHVSHSTQFNLYLWLLNQFFENKIYMDIPEDISKREKSDFLERKKFFIDNAKYFPLTSGSIFVENKNTQETEEFDLAYDDACVKDVLVRIKELLTYTDTKTLPPQGFKRSSKQCRWCDYSDTCWGKGTLIDDILEDNKEGDKNV